MNNINATNDDPIFGTGAQMGLDTTVKGRFKPRDVNEKKAQQPKLFKDDPRIKRISVSEAMVKDHPPRELILPSIAKGVVAVLQGPGAVGKGMLTLSLSILVASGMDPAGLKKHQSWRAFTALGPVLYVSLEDNGEEVKRRLRAIATESEMFAGMTDEQRSKSLSDIDDNLEIADLTGSGITDLLDDAHKLEWLREEAKRRVLIIIDTLSRASRAKENESEEIVALITRMETVAEMGATVLVVHHIGKDAVLNNRGDSDVATRGSSVLPWNTRGTLYMAGMTEKEEATLWKKFSESRETFNRNDYVRFGIAKANHGPKWDHIWLRKAKPYQNGGKGTLVFADPLIPKEPWFISKDKKEQEAVEGELDSMSKSQKGHTRQKAGPPVALSQGGGDVGF